MKKKIELSWWDENKRTDCGKCRIQLKGTNKNRYPCPSFVPHRPGFNAACLNFEEDGSE